MSDLAAATSSGTGGRDAPTSARSDLLALAVILVAVAVGLFSFFVLRQQALGVGAYALIAFGYIFRKEHRRVAPDGEGTTRLEAGVAFAAVGVLVILYIVLLAQELQHRVPA